MKIIETKKYSEKQADLIIYPPIEKSIPIFKGKGEKMPKKKKKLPQLNIEVDDIRVQDFDQ